MFSFLTALRKQARHIENDIDVKLVAFSKVGAGSGTNTADTAPLLSENLFDSLSVEIVQMLDKVNTLFNRSLWCSNSITLSFQLSGINEKMAEVPTTGTAMMHTLQRHRDILNVILAHV